MRRFLTAIIAIIMVLTLCGCGESSSDNTGANGAVTNESVSSEKVPTIESIKGTYNGDVYENGYMGYKFTKPSDWTYSTEEEIAAMFENSGLGDTDFCDMLVLDSSTGNNINILYSIASDINLEDYLVQSENEIKQIGENLGMTSTFSSHESVKLGNIDCMRVEIESDIQGTKMYQACYAAYADGVLMNVTITVNDGTPIENFEAMFE